MCIPNTKIHQIILKNSATVRFRMSCEFYIPHVMNIIGIRTFEADDQEIRQE